MYFAGTAHQTRTCPRRLLIDHPDVHPVLDLWADTEGRLGVDGATKVSAHFGAALDVLAEARMERDRAAREKADRAK